nr:uncharacterized protein LOC109184816 [Ipomoea batatas]
MEWVGAQGRINDGSSCPDTNSDEWGMMTLKEKVYVLVYKEEGISLFSLTDNGLIELLTDEDACALVNYVVRPKLVEIWVVLGVVGNDEENNGEAEISADEGDGDSDWMTGDYANELSDSEFEIEQTDVDDLDFFNFIYPNVEYGGDEGGEGDGVEEHDEINPKYINPETYFSGSEGEGSEGNVRAEENDREPDEGNGRESDAHRIVLPSPFQSLNIGDEIIAHVVKPSYGPPPKKMKTINFGKGKQVTESHGKAKGKKSLGLTKARTQLTRKYRTRSSMVCQVHNSENNDAIEIKIRTMFCLQTPTLRIDKRVGVGALNEEVTLVTGVLARASTPYLPWKSFER